MYSSASFSHHHCQADDSLCLGLLKLELKSLATSTMHPTTGIPLQGI